MEITENNVQIIIGSPIDYNERVAYIVINEINVALVSQGLGKNNLKIEFFDDLKLTILDYEVFIEALNKAKTELLK